MCLGILVPSCLGMWALVSLFRTLTLGGVGGGGIFPEGFIGSFWSGAVDFMDGDTVVSECS